MSKNMIKHILSMMIIVASLHAPDLWAQIDHSATHHQDMQVQEGSAPDDARDPHAYSDGYSLTEDPYTQPGSRQLKLADEHTFWSVLANRLEYNQGSDSVVFDLRGWYGATYNRFVVKTEGNITVDRLEESQTDLLWSRAFSTYFDTQLGIRLDQYGRGRNRQWLAIGVQGLVPYWFDLDITAYLGKNGRTALAVEAKYELLLTQKLILQPRMELNLYGKDDPNNAIGSGLSDLSIGLRLRYEFNRQFAPYVGVEWSDTYGDTANYRQTSRKDISDTRFVVGLRFWF